MYTLTDAVMDTVHTSEKIAIQIKNNPIDIKKVFESYAKNNPLVQNVVDRKTTFLKEYEDVTKELRQSTLYKGKEIPKSKLERVRDLQECVGWFTEYVPNSKIVNPVTIGTAGAIGGFALGYVPAKVVQVSRRRMLGIMGTFAGLGGLLGVYATKVTFEMMLKDMNRAERNAKYLDGIYSNLR